MVFPDTEMEDGTGSGALVRAQPGDYVLVKVRLVWLSFPGGSRRSGGWFSKGRGQLSLFACAFLCLQTKSEHKAEQTSCTAAWGVLGVPSPRDSGMAGSARHCECCCPAPCGAWRGEAGSSHTARALFIPASSRAGTPADVLLQHSLS